MTRNRLLTAQETVSECWQLACGERRVEKASFPEGSVSTQPVSSTGAEGAEEGYPKLDSCLWMVVQTHRRTTREDTFLGVQGVSYHQPV